MVVRTPEAHVSIQRVKPQDTRLFQTIASDVFDEPIDAGRLATYIETPGHLMVIAVCDDQIVGQASAVVHRHPDKTDELYIDEVGTASSYLRQGIATRMLEELFAWGRELGCTEAWLGTDLDNQPANGLYRRLGGSGDTMAYYEFEL